MMMMDIEQASVMAVSELNGGCHGGPFVPDRQQKRWGGGGEEGGVWGVPGEGVELEPGEVASTGGEGGGDQKFFRNYNHSCLVVKTFNYTATG